MVDTKKIEASMLIEAIYQKYGYDFRHYNLKTIIERFEKMIKENQMERISDMIPRVLHDERFFTKLFLGMSVTATEMFRNPHVFKLIREVVVPMLKTYPYFNIWHAGCATGEEVYSMAILLKEENLYHKTQIYATDINDESLQIAKKGIYSLQQMKEYTNNYNKAGGKASLSDYYHVKYRACKIKDELKENIVFAKHNLVSDGVFAEMNLIFCRNVLIYFNPILKRKVVSLFNESLCRNGFFCLGDKESIDASLINNEYTLVNEKNKLYKKAFYG